MMSLLPEFMTLYDIDSFMIMTQVLFISNQITEGIFILNTSMLDLFRQEPTRGTGLGIITLHLNMLVGPLKK
jgi:hypothetical protein